MRRRAGLLAALVRVTLLAVGSRSDCRVCRLEAGHASAIRMASLWNDIAAKGDFDPDNAGIQQLWLEYSPLGVLMSASIQAFTFDYEFVQVGFVNYERPTDDRVFISGGISSVASLPSYSLLPAAFVFRAIDEAGPSSMIAWLNRNGSEERFVISVRDLSIPSEAAAYLWNGTSFTNLAPTDDRRLYSTDSGFFVAFAAI